MIYKLLAYLYFILIKYNQKYTFDLGEIVIMMIGIPTSGKTTVAKYLHEGLGLYIISSDELKNYLRKLKIWRFFTIIGLHKIITQTSIILYKNKKSFIIDSNIDKTIYQNLHIKNSIIYKYRHYFIYCHVNEKYANERMNKRIINNDRGIISFDELKNILNSIEFPKNYLQVDISKQNSIEIINNFFTYEKSLYSNPSLLTKN